MKMSVACVCLALLAGCGGSAGEQTGNDDTMSAAAWSKRVEAICVKIQAKSFAAGRNLGRRSAAAGDSKQVLAYKVLRLESKLLGPWIDQIDALPAPKGREQVAGKFIANMRSVGELLGQTATAIQHNDAANGKKLVKQLAAKTTTTRSQARSLNIGKCNPSPQGAGSSS